MISKRMKTFIVDEKEVQFNTTKFKELFCRYAMKKDSLKGEYEQEIANELYVDSSAIHNWRMGLNGPGDLEKIHKLEKYWHLQENSLLMEVKTMENTNTVMRPLSDMEREFIMRAYNAYCSFVNEFADSDGFKYSTDREEMMDFDLPDEKRTPYDSVEKIHLFNEFYNLIEEEGFFILSKRIYEIMVDFLDRARTMYVGDLESLYELFQFDKSNMSPEDLFFGNDYHHYDEIVEGERLRFRDEFEPFLAF